MVREEKGDLLETPCRHIAHGVNCWGVMGSGVAKAIYTKWPTVKEEYITFCDRAMPLVQNGQEDLLGAVHEVHLLNKSVFNCFTQDHYLPRTIVHLDYKALRECFEHITKMELRRLAIPKIGCGLAGGDWTKVKEIINDVTKDDLEVIAYYL